MRKLPSALQRGLVVGLLFAAVMPLGTYPAGLARAQEPTPQGADAPTSSWSPPPASTFQFTYTGDPHPRVTARVFGDFGKVFANTAHYRIFNADGSPRTPFKTIVPVPLDGGNTAVMTVTDSLLYGSGTIQFGIAYTDSPGDLLEATYTLSTEYKLWMPRSSKPEPAAGPLEPNSNPCQATPANRLTNNVGAPDDQYDFFSFFVPTTSTVYFTVTNFTVPGQMQFRVANSNFGACSPTASTDIATYVSMPPNDQVLVLPSVTPGTYYARLSTASTTSNTPYNFVWNYVVSPFGLLEPNSDPCQATPANPLTNYIGAPDDLYDFFSFYVPTTSTVYFTVTNFTVPGQMQFRSITDLSTCSPTASTAIVAYIPMPPNDQFLVVPNVNPGVYYARLSTAGSTTTVPYSFRWNYVQGSAVLEPNNSSCTAWPVATGQTYQAYAEDPEDWYAFDINATSFIAIAVAGYPATGQYLLYRQNSSNCNDISLITNVPNTTGYFTADNQPAARYFLRVATTGGYNGSQLYAFHIDASVSQVWNPNFTTNPTPYQPDICSNISVGGNCTFYWNGMGNSQGAITGILIQVVGVQNLGSCGAGDAGSVTPGGYANNFTSVGTSQSGSITFTFPKGGGYNVNIRVTRSGQADWNDGKPVKVGCMLQANEKLSEPPAPTVTPVPWVTPQP